jgi:hypothetical protein
MLTLGQPRNAALLGYARRGGHDRNLAPPYSRGDLLVGNFLQRTYDTHTPPSFLGNLAYSESCALGDGVDESDGMRGKRGAKEEVGGMGMLCRMLKEKTSEGA